MSELLAQQVSFSDDSGNILGAVPLVDFAYQLDRQHGRIRSNSIQLPIPSRFSAECFASFMDMIRDPIGAAFSSTSMSVASLTELHDLCYGFLGFHENGMVAVIRHYLLSQRIKYSPEARPETPHVCRICGSVVQRLLSNVACLECYLEILDKQACIFHGKEHMTLMNTGIELAFGRIQVEAEELKTLYFAPVHGKLVCAICNHMSTLFKKVSESKVQYDINNYQNTLALFSRKENQ